MAGRNGSKHRTRGEPQEAATAAGWERMVGVKSVVASE